jgi:hypothetical protein
VPKLDEVGVSVGELAFEVALFVLEVFDLRLE